MKYMWWSYQDYLACPMDILQAIIVRMELEGKNNSQKVS